jgi:hypothetical protein
MANLVAVFFANSFSSVTVYSIMPRDYVISTRLLACVVDSTPVYLSRVSLPV